MKNDDFEQQLKADLINIENDISPEINKQLRASRKRAITHYKPGKSRRLRKSLWWPTGGMVAASLLTYALVLSPFSPLTGNHDMMIDETITENLDWIVDMDFYYWLSENEAKLRG